MGKEAGRQLVVTLEEGGWAGTHPAGPVLGLLAAAAAVEVEVEVVEPPARADKDRVLSQAEGNGRLCRLERPDRPDEVRQVGGRRLERPAGLDEVERELAARCDRRGRVGREHRRVGWERHRGERERKGASGEFGSGRCGRVLGVDCGRGRVGKGEQELLDGRMLAVDGLPTVVSFPLLPLEGKPPVRLRAGHNVGAKAG